jgi:hypothetical protein
VLGWGRFYHGGELLQWSFFPWFVLLALRCRALGWRQIAALSLALTLGIFAKSAFVIVGASVITSASWIEVRKLGGPFRVRALLLAARVAIVLVVALAAFGLYVSSSRSPVGVSTRSLSSIDVRELLFAAAGPLNSLFDIWRGYIPVTESAVWTASGIDLQLLACSLGSLLLLWAIVRFSGSQREYLTLLVGVYACVVASFSLAWSLDLLISFNVRHFRVVGILFVPGIVAMLARLPSRPGRLVSLGLLALLAIVPVIRFVYPTDRNPLARPVGAAGFSHSNASQSSVDALAELDVQLRGGNDLIGVPWPQMALDVQTSRIFDMRIALEGAKSFQHKLLYGRVDNLIVVLPRLVNDRGMTPRVLRAFKEHRDWRRIRPEVEDFVFMYSGEQDDLH